MELEDSHAPPRQVDTDLHTINTETTACITLTGGKKFVSKIDITRLQRAERELASIAERRSGPFKNRDIDWQVIRQVLTNLATALRAGDRASFDQELEKLRTRLAAPNQLRGKIGGWENARMPARVEELFNQFVDQVHNEVTTATIELPSERADKDAAAKDILEGQN